ncbi:protein Tube [Drosophila sulfurigaster albostrigata]|uniref:protein Tube n=1 Tax=Drosophila sulfurigaster albostrigata TaxID=89887 RepID=UPI002D21C4D1|nr:protein Tube [Drosophila sulfurigaster albostrigata]
MEMAESNGPTTSTTSNINNHSKYTRYTELRRVEDNDIYKLATILDRHDCWRKLMSKIPKQLDATECSAPGVLNFKEIATRVGYKYNEHQINLIASEHVDRGQSISQIMIDEWKTSGKQWERPTVGVLLQLLIHAEIYSAADYVANNFLSELNPERPADGPAAFVQFNTELSEEMDVDESSSFQPDTSELNAGQAQARGTHMNVDFYEKHMVRRDKSMPQPEQAIAAAAAETRPQRPPRGRQRTTTTNSNATSNNTTSNAATSQAIESNIPFLSMLNASSNDETSTSHSSAQIAALPQSNIPNLSLLNGSSETLSTELATSTNSTTSTTASARTETGAMNGSSNVPMITLLLEHQRGEISSTINASTTAIGTATATTSATVADLSYNNLPAISALNLNAASGSSSSSKDIPNGTVSHNDDDNSSGTSSLSNDDDDDDDNDEDVDVDDEEADVSLPNLSNSEHQTSNNDSSLTTVTGTSGDNSFEMINDSSSASNDDDNAHNIPNVSELQKK